MQEQSFFSFNSTKCNCYLKENPCFIFLQMNRLLVKQTTWNQITQFWNFCVFTGILWDRDSLLFWEGTSCHNHATVWSAAIHNQGRINLKYCTGYWQVLTGSKQYTWQIHVGFKMLLMLSVYETADDIRCCSVIGYKIAIGNVALKWFRHKLQNFV